MVYTCNMKGSGKYKKRKKVIVFASLTEIMRDLWLY